MPLSMPFTAVVRPQLLSSPFPRRSSSVEITWLGGSIPAPSLSFLSRPETEGKLLRSGARIRARSGISDASSNFTPTSTSTAAASSTSSSSSMTSIIEDLERAQQEQELELELEQERDQQVEVPDEEKERRKQRQHQPREGLAARWRELAGCNDWAGLLDPMDPFLRAELIRYGEFAQACYDAFDYDPYSKYCGSCRFSRQSLFENLQMEGVGYDVTRYLYATSNAKLPNFSLRSRFPKIWSEVGNWIGFVSVSDDATTARLGRRDIVIAWRGTVTRMEWVADLTAFLKPVSADGIPAPDDSIKVESGFMDLYTDKDPNCPFCKHSAREQVLTEVRRLLQKYAVERGEEVSITVTGHSLGSALAMVNAYDVAEVGLNKVGGGRTVPICVYSFSGPRVGNTPFKERFEGALGVKALRVVNVHDTVPKVPGVLFNESVPAFFRWIGNLLPYSYTHVGVELELDHRRSPFLKQTFDPVCSHNLEAHLHLLDGHHGKGKNFELATGRDPTLVNKGCDFLQDEHMVPPNWRQDENKGLIRTSDGSWTQTGRSRREDHPTVDHPEDIHHHLNQLGLVSND